MPDDTEAYQSGPYAYQRGPNAYGPNQYEPLPGITSGAPREPWGMRMPSRPLLPPKTGYTADKMAVKPPTTDPWSDVPLDALFPRTARDI